MRVWALAAPGTGEPPEGLGIQAGNLDRLLERPSVASLQLGLDLHLVAARPTRFLARPNGEPFATQPPTFPSPGGSRRQGLLVRVAIDR